jgi:hypothetical protein
LRGIRDQAVGGAAAGLKSVENGKTIFPIVPLATNEVIERLNHINFIIFWCLTIFMIIAYLFLFQNPTPILWKFLICRLFMKI